MNGQANDDACERLMTALWPGKYDNRTRTWDWCGCVAPASEHFVRGFCPLLGMFAARDGSVEEESHELAAGAEAYAEHHDAAVASPVGSPLRRVHSALGDLIHAHRLHNRPHGPNEAQSHEGVSAGQAG